MLDTREQLHSSESAANIDYSFQSQSLLLCCTSSSTTSMFWHDSIGDSQPMHLELVEDSLH